MFLTYCQSIGKTIDFSTVTAADLAPILESFFVDVRGKNGEPYKGNSLKAAKGAIQRLLSAKDRRINIFQDAEFDKMRKVFAGLLKDRRRSGEEASVLHKEPLTDADWELLFWKLLEASLLEASGSFSSSSEVFFASKKKKG